MAHKVLWDGVSLKLRFDAKSLHNLSHAISSEVYENQCVTVCVCVCVCVCEEKKKGVSQ